MCAIGWETPWGKAGVIFQKLYTSVKTWFGSVLRLFDALVKYLKAISILYSTAKSPNLWQRKPTLC